MTVMHAVNGTSHGLVTLMVQDNGCAAAGRTGPGHFQRHGLNVKTIDDPRVAYKVRHQCRIPAIANGGVHSDVAFTQHTAKNIVHIGYCIVIRHVVHHRCMDISSVRGFPSRR